MIKTAITGYWRFAVYLVIAIIYYLLCYVIARNQTAELFALFAALFIFYLALLKFHLSDNLIREGVIFAIFLRVVLLFSTPNLSDDFYRFIWDGNLINNDINPFAAAPETLHQLEQDHNVNTGSNAALYNLLNSKQYFSVYPPVCQGIFAITSAIAAGNIYLNILLLKIVILLFEAGTILILIRLLALLNISKSHVLIYAANPLIIIELCGNIHFEAAMIFFLTLSFYFLILKKDLIAAILFGFAISSKLLPLIFLPLLFKYIGVKRSLIFAGIAGMTTIITFLPFLDNTLLQNLSSSINLYFNEFEYNASLYYLGKWLGGWNKIEVKHFLQGVLPVIAFMGIIGLSVRYKKTSFFSAALFALVIYFICSTTVHPWYITVLVLFAAITGYRFVIYWSGLIMLTYITYQTNLYLENFYLVALEYLVVISVMIYELNSRHLKIG